MFLQPCPIPGIHTSTCPWGLEHLSECHGTWGASSGAGLLGTYLQGHLPSASYPGTYHCRIGHLSLLAWKRTSGLLPCFQVGLSHKLLQMIYMFIYIYIYMCSHFRLKFLLGVVFLNSITGFQPWSHQVITYEISRPGIKKTCVVKYVQDCTAWNCLQLRWSNAEQKSQS